MAHFLIGFNSVIHPLIIMWELTTLFLIRNFVFSEPCSDVCSGDSNA